MFYCAHLPTVSQNTFQFDVTYISLSFCAVCRLKVPLQFVHVLAGADADLPHNTHSPIQHFYCGGHLIEHHFITVPVILTYRHLTDVGAVDAY